VVLKHVRTVALIKVAIMSYYPYYFAVIAHNTEQHCGFGSAVPPKISYYPGVIYPTLASTGLNAITRFRIRFQNLKPFKREKNSKLIAQTGYFNRNVILIFRFEHLFRAALM